MIWPRIKSRRSQGPPKKVSIRLKLHYRVGYIQHLYRKLRLQPLIPYLDISLKVQNHRFINSHLKLAPSASIRRTKRTGSPNTNQSPESNSPSSNQPSRSLALADTNHALGILGLSLAFRVHDAVDRATNTEIRRWLDDKWQAACCFPEVVDL